MTSSDGGVDAWQWRREEDIECPKCNVCLVFSKKDRDQNEPQYACYYASCRYDWFQSTPDTSITELYQQISTLQIADVYGWHWKADINCPMCFGSRVYSKKDRGKDPQYACQDARCLYDWFHSMPNFPITDAYEQEPCPECGWRSLRDINRMVHVLASTTPVTTNILPRLSRSA